MKNYYIIIFLLCSNLVAAQDVSLSDLENICRNKNWEPVNTFLMNKGWEYFTSEKGDTEKYDIISWSYEKSYGDKAKGWFNLYSYEGKPSKITYSVFNKKAYQLIFNSLKSKNYKLQESKIEDNIIYSTYSNDKYFLEVSTEQLKDEDDFSNESVTGYNFIFIAKSSMYDPNNGDKIQYHEDGGIEAKYTLKDGELEGEFIYYYSNGNIQKKGVFRNGLQNGQFFEFDELGNLIAEYTMINGKKHGKYTSYENGEVSVEKFYKEDALNGSFISYLYNNGRVVGKTKGEYLDNKFNGRWEFFYLEDNEEKLLTYKNLKNGLLNGAFQEVKGDSVIIGTYQNDKLHGTIRIYRDFFAGIINNIPRTDTTEITLRALGRYAKGSKTGIWNYFDETGYLIKKGEYTNDQKNGIWSYYYPKYVNDEGEPLEYAGKLYLTEIYSEDELNGESIRYSYIDKFKYKCDTIIYEKKLDSCFNQRLVKVFNKVSYKDNLLNGPAVFKDSIGNIIQRGNYLNDQKDGLWLERYLIDYIEEPFYINSEGIYKKGLKQGKWKEYLDEGLVLASYNLHDGSFHGDQIKFVNNGKPSRITKYVYGKLKEIYRYDSLGENLLKKYELQEFSHSAKVKLISYKDNYPEMSLEYTVETDEEPLNYENFELNFLLKIRNKSEDVYTDGEIIMYDDSGNLLVTGNLDEDQKVGFWNYYYPEQNIYIKIEFVNGNPGTEIYYNFDSDDFFTGVFYSKDSNGNIDEKRKIKNGFRHGATVYYKNQKIVKKEKYKNGLLN